MCDGKIEKGTASAVAAIACGKMERGEKGTSSVVAAIVAAIACGCDGDDKMERGEKGTASVVAAIAIACGCDRVWL